MTININNNERVEMWECGDFRLGQARKRGDRNDRLTIVRKYSDKIRLPHARKRSDQKSRLTIVRETTTIIAKIIGSLSLAMGMTGSLPVPRNNNNNDDSLLAIARKEPRATRMIKDDGARSSSLKWQ